MKILLCRGPDYRPTFEWSGTIMSGKMFYIEFLLRDLLLSDIMLILLCRGPDYRPTLMSCKMFYIEFLNIDQLLSDLVQYHVKFLYREPEYRLLLSCRYLVQPYHVNEQKWGPH